MVNNNNDSVNESTIKSLITLIENMTKEQSNILTTVITSLLSTNSSNQMSNTNTLESSSGVPICDSNSPWATKYYSEPCYLCFYFGHGFETCPNIQDDFKGTCLRCFGTGHKVSDCVISGQKNPQ